MADDTKIDVLHGLRAFLQPAKPAQTPQNVGSQQPTSTTPQDEPERKWAREPKREMYARLSHEQLIDWVLCFEAQMLKWRKEAHQLRNDKGQLKKQLQALIAVRAAIKSVEEESNK